MAVRWWAAGWPTHRAKARGKRARHRAAKRRKPTDRTTALTTAERTSL